LWEIVGHVQLIKVLTIIRLEGGVVNHHLHVYTLFGQTGVSIVANGRKAHIVDHLQIGLITVENRSIYSPCKCGGFWLQVTYRQWS
jgi:hypothetical protein